MAKSKKRGGEKVHRKRVQNRNNIVKAKENAIQKLFNESMKTQIEEMRKNYEAQSGNTENVETNEVGLV
jgi:hypothetical protein